MLSAERTDRLNKKKKFHQLDFIAWYTLVSTRIKPSFSVIQAAELLSYLHFC